MIASSLSGCGSSSDTGQSLYSWGWSEGLQLCPEPASGHQVPSKGEDQEGGNPHRIATPVDQRGHYGCPASVYSHGCGQTSCVHSPTCIHTAWPLCAPHPAGLAWTLAVVEHSSTSSWCQLSPVTFTSPSQTHGIFLTDIYFFTLVMQLTRTLLWGFSGPRLPGMEITDVQLP